MRTTIVALAFACIGNASVAVAQGLEYGPRIAVSIPAQDAAEALITGASYGVTGTFFTSPRKGFGVDIGYHRWPGSPDVDRSLDRLFSALFSEPISGTRTTVSAVQATIHAKVLAIERGPVLPWIKVGLGGYRLNRKLELPIAALQAAGAQVIQGSPDNISHEIGCQVSAGLDLRITSDTALSLDASYHAFTTRNQILSAFAIGACLLTRPR